MNILIPDKWLREYLKTEATPKQLKEYLSLCGPSVERINTINKELVYDIEVTTNRPDSMSVVGIAREAAVILPRFDISAEFVNDPYSLNSPKIVNRIVNIYVNLKRKPMHITSNPQLNPRWTSVVFENISVKASPEWMQQLLTLSGIRPINNIVDITNYFLRAFGQPAHAFDYDRIRTNKKSIPTMILRASKKGEKIQTLDGRNHVLPGDDIVIEDGAGRLIDLCGIMGAENSKITDETRTIILFMQTYDPVRIRKTSMALAQRSEASSLFEKGLDTKLVLPTIFKGIELFEQLAGGKVASKIYDIYPKPYIPHTVSVKRTKVNAYLGVELQDLEIKNILKPLGFITKLTQDSVSITVPSFRPDIKIDVDIIEEIARIYGYHIIENHLPDTEPPQVFPDPTLTLEDELKTRLRDWGYTETYTYSMISEQLMDIFEFDKAKSYKIANPLSDEWVYMRTSLLPSLLSTAEYNLHYRSEFKLFELSMIYEYQKNELPKEKANLVVLWTGQKFLEAKGIAEVLCELSGIPFSQESGAINLPYYQANKSLNLGALGKLGEIDQELLQKLKIKSAITILEMDIDYLVKNQKQTKRYQPISKYPPVIEDLTFVLPERTPIGKVLETIKSVSPHILDTRLVNQYENSYSFMIRYGAQDIELTKTDIEELRTKIVSAVTSSFNAQIKSASFT